MSVLLRHSQLLVLVLSHPCSLLFSQAFLFSSAPSVIELPQLYLEPFWVALSPRFVFNTHFSVKACAADFIKYEK